MHVDTVVLAGGRSSRLGGTPKADLIYRGRTLVQNTLAASPHGHRVVVGPDNHATEEVLVTRESPPFAGPASAVAAGFTALRRVCGDSTGCTLVLACDMPQVSEAVTVLLTGLDTLSRDAAVDGVIAVDASGHRQPLAALYRSAALADRIAHFTAQNTLTGLSMRALISGLALSDVPIPTGSTDDIDLWSDAARHNIPQPAPQPNQEHS